MTEPIIRQNPCPNCTEGEIEYTSREIQEGVQIVEQHNCNYCDYEERLVFYYNPSTLAYQQIKPE